MLANRSLSIGSRVTGAALACALLVPAAPAGAAGQREAPAVSRTPAVDGSDFYLFRSYEPGREGFVTLIANYHPLQDPFSGPIYFPLDPDAFYDIHIINDGDEDEDLTFRFRFSQPSPELAVPVGNPGEEVLIPIPLVNSGPLDAGDLSNQNVRPRYTVRLIRGRIDDPDRTVGFLRQIGSGDLRFRMPFDNIGTKSIPDYAEYAAAHVYDVQIPGCGAGRVFAGQREESTRGDLGGLFDLLNIDGLFGSRDARPSPTAGHNVTSLALEVPIGCLTEGQTDVVAGWTTARLPRVRVLKDVASYNDVSDDFGDHVQVSRLGNPLVSQVLIGLPHKDLYNSIQPRQDALIVHYVTHPSLPEVLEDALADQGVVAPNLFPRDDLIVGFMTGAPGLTETATQGEVMRLNTAVPPVAPALQNNLGVLAGDAAGYPNGRRPGDDVIDNSLRVLMGATLPLALAPSGQLGWTDGVWVDATQFQSVFPYLNDPVPGAD
jgi:hypothetical protein